MQVMLRRKMTVALLVLIAECVHGADPVWTTVAPIPTPRKEFATAVVGGTIYAIGGYQGPSYGTILATVEAYDTATNTWSTKASLPVPTRLLENSGAAIGGTIYIAGGTPDLYGCCSSTLWAYDTATDSWSAKAPMPTARVLIGVSEHDGKLYTIGGYNGFDLPIVEIYEPSTDSWVKGASMPTARSAFAVSVTSGVVYAIGGQGPFMSFFSTVEAYDPATNAWTTKASLPAGRVNTGASLTGGLIYVAGGEGPDGVFNADVWAYNPFTDTWSTKTPMPRARDELGVVAIGATIYVIGGGLGCDGCTAYSETDAGVLPPGRMTCAVSVTPGAQHVGRWMTVRVTVTNTGDFVFANLVPSVSVNTGNGLVSLVSGPVPSATPYLPPGWIQAFTWTFSVSGIGTVVFTATVTGYDLASCTTMLVSSSSTVILEPRIEEPPPPRNPLLLGTPGAALDRNAITLNRGEVVLARIAPKDGSTVTVKVYTASGRLVRTLRRLTALSDGQWLVTWDGKTEDEMPVSRGVYVVRVTGGGLDERLKVVAK